MKIPFVQQKLHQRWTNLMRHVTWHFQGNTQKNLELKVLKNFKMLSLFACGYFSNYGLETTVNRSSFMMGVSEILLPIFYNFKMICCWQIRQRFINPIYQYFISNWVVHSDQQMSKQQKKHPKDICTVRIIYIPYHW